MRRAIVLALCLLAGCDGGNGNEGGGGGGATNQAPTFTSSATATYAENTAADIPVYKAVATDPEGASIVYGIRNGSETPFFGIKPTGEVMVVVDVPDFENPKDVDKDNVYHVVITASDGVNTTEMNLAITITDVDEGSRAQVFAVLPTSSDMTAMAAGTGTSRVFVGQNTGQVYMYDTGTTTAPQLAFTMAGLSSRTGSALNRDYYYGLLGLIAAPDYASSGILYALVTSTDDHLELRRYRLNASGTPTSVEIVLRTPIPARSTSVPVDPLKPAPADAVGGGLAFSSDGYLFVATGQVDGYSAGAAIGARTDTLFGKILRLDVSQDGFPADPDRNYAIPPQIPGNPLNGTAALPEIYLLGLRDPKGISVHGDELFVSDGDYSAYQNLSPQYVYRVARADAGKRTGSGSGELPPAYSAPNSRWGGDFLYGGIVYRSVGSPTPNRFYFSTRAGGVRSIALADLVPGGANATYREEWVGGAYVFALDQQGYPLTLSPGPGGAAYQISRITPY